MAVTATTQGNVAEELVVGNLERGMAVEVPHQVYRRTFSIAKLLSQESYYNGVLRQQRDRARSQVRHTLEKEQDAADCYINYRCLALPLLQLHFCEE